MSESTKRLKRLKYLLICVDQYCTGNRTLCICRSVSVCVSVQDFYSHSNWVELGNREPYINLIRSDLPLENLAGEFVLVAVTHYHPHTSRTVCFSGLGKMS